LIRIPALGLVRIPSRAGPGPRLALGGGQSGRLIPGPLGLDGQDGPDQGDDETDDGDDGADPHYQDAVLGVHHDGLVDHLEGEAGRRGVDVEVIEPGSRGLELGHRAETTHGDLVAGPVQGDVL
jgi:hypothetical protein